MAYVMNRLTGQAVLADPAVGRVRRAELSAGDKVTREALKLQRLQPHLTHREAIRLVLTRDADLAAALKAEQLGPRFSERQAPRRGTDDLSLAREFVDVYNDKIDAGADAGAAYCDAAHDCPRGAAAYKRLSAAQQLPHDLRVSLSFGNTNSAAADALGVKPRQSEKSSQTGKPLIERLKPVSSGSKPVDAAWRLLSDTAQEIMQRVGGSYDEAFARACAERPDLYEIYRKGSYASKGDDGD